MVYVAAYTGNLAADNALNGDSLSVDLSVVPRVTFTDPAIASVGSSEAEALERGLEIAVMAMRFGIRVDELGKLLHRYLIRSWRGCISCDRGRRPHARAASPDAHEALRASRHTAHLRDRVASERSAANLTATHVTQLGLVVNDDGGPLVMMLVVVLLCAGRVLVSRRKELPWVGSTL